MYVCDWGKEMEETVMCFRTTLMPRENNAHEIARFSLGIHSKIHINQSIANE